MKANTFTLHLLGRKEAGLHGDLDTLGEEQGDKAPGQIKLQTKKRNIECIERFRFIPFHISGWSPVSCSEVLF